MVRPSPFDKLRVRKLRVRKLGVRKLTMRARFLPLILALTLTLSL